MKTKKLLALGLSLAMTLALCACGAKDQPAPNDGDGAGTDATEPVLLKVNMSESAQDNKAIAIDQVVANIEKRTEGRIKFEVYHNGELGTFQDDVEAIVAGGNIIDGTSSSAFADYGCDDMMGMDLMRAFHSPEDVATFNGSDLFKEMTDELAANSGIKMLCMNWCGQPRCVLATSPVNSVADLDGKIIRVPTATYTAFFTRLGATTASMSMGETYTAMSQGTVDACEFPLTTIYSNSLFEVGKYLYLSEHTYAATCWVMNNDIFDSLSAEDQAIVLEEFEKGGEYFTELSLSSLDEYKEKLEAEGVTIVEPSEEDKAVMDEAALQSAEDFPNISEGFMARLAEAAGRK